MREEGRKERSAARAASRSSTPVLGGVQPLLAMVPALVFQVLLRPAARSTVSLFVCPLSKFLNQSHGAEENNDLIQS